MKNNHGKMVLILMVISVMASVSGMTRLQISEKEDSENTFPFETVKSSGKADVLTGQNAINTSNSYYGNNNPDIGTGIPARVHEFDLTNYSVAGFRITQVDVNVTNDLVTAENDWAFKGRVPSYTTNTERIKNDDPTSNYCIFAHNMNESSRYKVGKISIKNAISTMETPNVEFPALELWNTTGGNPGSMFFSTNLPDFQSVSWANYTVDYIINASNIANTSWNIVINATNWGMDADNVDSSNAIVWYYLATGSDTGFKRTYAGTWSSSSRCYGYRYQRLYLNDSTDDPRQFQSNEIMTINGTLDGNNDKVSGGYTFDGDGHTSVTGTNITKLYFESNTSVSTHVTFLVHYTLDKTTPFTITNDVEWADYADSGSGTAGDPWILSGFNINAAGSGSCITIMTSTNHAVIRDSVFAGSASGLYAGIGVMMSSNVDVINCTFLDPDVGSSGLAFAVATTCTLSDSTFLFNDSVAAYGIVLDSCNGIVIDNCQVENTTLAGFAMGVLALTPTCVGVLVNNCTFTTCTTSILIQDTNDRAKFSNITSTGSTADDLSIEYNSGTGYMVFENCNFTSTTGACVYINDVGDVLFDLCIFADGNDGITMTSNGHNITVQNSEITDITNDAFYSNAITSIDIVNVTISNAGKDGVDVESFTTLNLLNVDISDCGEWAINTISGQINFTNANVTDGYGVSIDSAAGTIIDGCYWNLAGAFFNATTVTTTNITQTLFDGLFTGEINLVTSTINFTNNAYSDYFYENPSVTQLGWSEGDILPENYTGFTGVNDSTPFFSDILFHLVTLDVRRQNVTGETISARWYDVYINGTYLSDDSYIPASTLTNIVVYDIFGEVMFDYTYPIIASTTITIVLDMHILIVINVNTISLRFVLTKLSYDYTRTISGDSYDSFTLYDGHYDYIASNAQGTVADTSINMNLDKVLTITSAGIGGGIGGGDDGGDDGGSGTLDLTNPATLTVIITSVAIVGGSITAFSLYAFRMRAISSSKQTRSRRR